MTDFGKHNRMGVNASRSDLMRSLGQLVRGLSALFWGLPVALVLCAQAVTSNLVLSLGVLGLVGPGLAHAVLLYGLWLMGSFQAQERIWVAALDRARLFSLLNVGLSPFLHWHQRAPDVEYFSHSAVAMGASSLCFLFCLNRVLRRLAAMLPDETLRVETSVFTTLNLSLLVILPALLTSYLIVIRIEDLPLTIRMAIQLLQPVQHWLVLFLVLLPVAVTMSLIWKIKEAVFSCVFEESPRH